MVRKINELNLPPGELFRMLDQQAQDKVTFKQFKAGLESLGVELVEEVWEEFGQRNFLFPDKSLTREEFLQLMASFY